jgi:hypothetical protein
MPSTVARIVGGVTAAPSHKGRSRSHSRSHSKSKSRSRSRSKKY